jgi:hypothetical protein
MLAKVSHLAYTRAAYAVLATGLLGLAIFAAADHGLWAPFVLGVVGPDLALAYGAGPGMSRGQLHPRAVPAYNAVHRFWAPAALLAVGAVAGPWLLVLGLAWATHVAVDRAVGYGLRDAEGFQRAG